jgi:hypothetical protein
MKKKKDGKEVLKDFIQLLVGELLQESKQQILNLGFPEVIASILYKRFGASAPLIARWFKESKIGEKKEAKKNWWRDAFNDWSARSTEPTLLDLVDVYHKKTNGDYPEKDKSYLENIENTLEKYGENDLKSLRSKIESKLNSDWFFTNNLLTVTDLNPYKKLSFEEAKKKYDEKRIFEDQTPVKAYSNGWRWINVGPRCELVGKKMSNCGSAGVMSMDPDKTIITLFDEHQNPHVVVTYSPNEKRISGDEGAGSTGVKPEYHNYVLDLVKTLGVQFDYNRSKSPELRLKGALGAAVQKIEPYFENSLNIIYLLKMRDGKMYYTNSYDFISKNDLDAFINAKRAEEGKAPVKLEKKHRTEKLGYALNRNNKVPGLISLYDFKKLYSEEK